MNPELAALLERLSELTNDELADLHDRLTAEFDGLYEREERTADDLTVMGEITEALEKVRTENETRETAAAEAQAAADELRSRVHPADPNAEGGEGTDGGEGSETGTEGEGTETGTETGTEGADGGEGTEGAPSTDPAPLEDPSPVESTDPPEAVAASAGTPTPRPRPGLGSLSQRRPSSGAPRGTGEGATDRLTARTEAQRNFRRRAGRPLAAGDPIDSTDDLVDGTMAAIRTLGRGSGEVAMVASIVTEYPEARTLTGDPEADTAKIDAVTSFPAITASGGICAPLNVDYAIDVMADASEPIADADPSFNASRGGLRFIKPPTMASVGASGTRKWTVADDVAVDPADPATLKPVQTFICGEEVEVVVDAYPTRLRFGNMAQRFSPEIVAANTRLAFANAARTREVERLRQRALLSTEVTATQLLGASRDTLATLDQAIAAYRYRNRIPRSVGLRAIFPDFAIDLFRADLTRELAHDRDGQNNLALSDAQVLELVTARGVRPTFTLDAVPVRDTGTGAVTWDLQGFGAQADKAALNPWPAELVFFLYAEGTFQNLDGGQVDYGVIRDSALDAANDYEVMIESFFATAKRGVESLLIVQPVDPNGASAGTVATTGP